MSVKSHRRHRHHHRHHPWWVRPRLIGFSQGFQVVFIHLVYISVLFLTSCCCSFLLHVVVSLICMFLVSGQLVLLLAVPKFLHSFCGQKGCALLFFSKISSQWWVPVPNTLAARMFGAATTIIMGHMIVQLVKVLHYKLEGRGLDSWWGHWDFLWT